MPKELFGSGEMNAYELGNFTKRPEAPKKPIYVISEINRHDDIRPTQNAINMAALSPQRVISQVDGTNMAIFFTQAGTFSHSTGPQY